MAKCKQPAHLKWMKNPNIEMVGLVFCLKIQVKKGKGDVPPGPAPKYTSGYQQRQPNRELLNGFNLHVKDHFQECYKSGAAQINKLC